MANKTARRLRKNPTEAEQRLWSRLRRRQLDGYFFRRQAPIGVFVVDFVRAERKLVIEVDGGQRARQIRRDAKRTAWLESQGYEVIRFWNNDVLGNTDGVVETILAVLRQEETHPLLLLGLRRPTGGTDDDRPGADDEDRFDVGPLRHGRSPRAGTYSLPLDEGA